MRLKKKKKASSNSRTNEAWFPSALHLLVNHKVCLNLFPLSEYLSHISSQEAKKSTNKVLLVCPLTKLATYFCELPFANLVEIVLQVQMLTKVDGQTHSPTDCSLTKNNCTGLLFLGKSIKNLTRRMLKQREKDVILTSLCELRDLSRWE